MSKRDEEPAEPVLQVNLNKRMVVEILKIWAMHEYKMEVATCEPTSSNGAWILTLKKLGHPMDPNR